MVYGIATTQGYSPEHVSGMYPSMESLNYQQNLSSKSALVDGYFVSPLDSLVYSFKNKFGINNQATRMTLNNNKKVFRNAGLKGNVNGVSYEVFPKKQILIKNKNKEVSFKVGDLVVFNRINYRITNIGTKLVIIKSNSGYTKRPSISSFVTNLLTY